jgi:hypothetical protein
MGKNQQRETVRKTTKEAMIFKGLTFQRQNQQRGAKKIGVFCLNPPASAKETAKSQIRLSLFL